MEFFSERRRMHKFYKSCGDGCPLRDYNCCCIQDFGEAEVKAVEKWSQEHPRKTRQDMFLEQWPEAALDEYGVVQPCPADISAAYRDTDGDCKIHGKRCKDCCREFWMQEVE